MQSGIYKISNTLTGRMYVGSAVNIKRRWDMHRSTLMRGIHHSGRLQRSWNKHGAAAFEFIVLEYVERAMLIEREQVWIDALNANRAGYNILPTAGSRLGKIVSAEARANMSAAQSRAPRTAETRAKISAAQKGKPRNPASIAKMAATKKGTRLSAVTVARMSASRIGTKLSPETIAKRSAKRMGMRHSAEAKAKMSATRKGQSLAIEHRANIGAALRGKPKSAETVAKRLATVAMKKAMAQAVQVPGRAANGQAFGQSGTP